MLFRHAKASWDEPALPDEKRPLTARGRAAAADIGMVLAVRGLVPDLVLCSPARRTQQTLELALPHWTPKPEIQTTPVLYGAAEDTYVEAIQSLGAGPRLMLVGHNPTIEETARLLTGQGTEDAIAKLRRGFKPGAIAVIGFDAADWRSVAPKSGTLADFLTPG